MRYWRDGTSALKPMVKSLRRGNIIFFLGFFISVFDLEVSLICHPGWFVYFSVSREKSDKEIMREIQAIMRQIASSITYLPCFDEPCKYIMPNPTKLHFLSGCFY